MAVIERHRSVLDRLTGHNKPVRARAPIGHARTAAAMSNNTTGVHAAVPAKPEGRFWIALAVIGIITVLALMGLYTATPQQSRPFDSKTVADLLKVGSAAIAIMAALIARYLVQSLILTGLATAWTSLFGTHKKSAEGATTIRTKGGRVLGTFIGFLLIFNVAIPLFHILTRKLGIEGLPGLSLVPILAIGYLVWYRHGHHTVKTGP
jgi:hypothetical protein